MNNCVGFPNGVNANRYITQTGTAATISTTIYITRSLIHVTLYQSDLFNFTAVIMEWIVVHKLL